MDYAEFHATMCREYAQDIEVQEHQWRHRKQWLCVVLSLYTLLVTTVLAPVVIRVIRQIYWLALAS